MTPMSPLLDIHLCFFVCVLSCSMATKYPRWMNNRYNLREVAPGIYVGGIYSFSVMADKVLSKVILTDIRTVRSDTDQKVLLRMIGEYGPVLYLPFNDQTPIPNYVFETVWAMYKSTGSILIACFAGISRSVSVTYAMLVMSGYSKEDAVALCFDPNQPPHPVTFESADRWVDSKLK